MILLVDGDAVAYAACISRNTRKNGEAEAVVLGLKPSEIFEDPANVEYLELCWSIFCRNINNLKETLFADTVLIAVKGEGNFRDSIFPVEVLNGKGVRGYKANRVKPEALTNVFVHSLRDLAVAELGAVAATGREADDLLRIWAEEARAAGDPFTICSIDKDLRCIKGNHWHLKKKELSVVGEVEARRLFYAQLLSGDPTDNIPGCKGIGPIRAAKAVADLETHEDMQGCVEFLYRETYGSGWYDELLTNGKLLYLQKYHDDYFDLSKWGVKRPSAKSNIPLAVPPSSSPVETTLPPPLVSPTSASKNAQSGGANHAGAPQGGGASPRPSAGSFVPPAKKLHTTPEVAVTVNTKKPTRLPPPGDLILLERKR